MKFCKQYTNEVTAQISVSAHIQTDTYKVKIDQVSILLSVLIDPKVQGKG